MAVRRTQNWLNQQRVDVPHMRSVESAVRNDFDELIGAFAIGQDKSYVIRGFELSMVGAIGSSASSLQMIVDGSALFHGASAVSGTFFQVPEGTPNEVLSSAVNSSVDGAFTPNALNYIGIEFVREIDSTTSAQLFLWDATNKTEFPKTAPLAQTLGYKIVISSSVWDSNVLPIAVVETDSSNNTIAVQDRRPLLFRLGSGGVNTPNPFNTYGWDNQVEGREENFWESSSSTSPFRGGDKQILHFKEWADAVMSSLLEIKGTPYWYTDNGAGGSLIKLRSDLGLMQLTGNGKFSHSATTPGEMNWDSDLFFKFIGSRLEYKINVNAATTDITLADGQVAYLNLVRDVDITPNLVFTNSSAIVTSVGAVSWTNDILAGDYIKVADEYDTQYFQVNAIDSASQVTLTEVFDGTSTGSAGTKARYAWGTYQTDAAPSTNRHIQIANRKDVPFDEDTFWLFIRDDNSGPTARIYIRGSSGGELEQGEDREISDNTTLDVLDYIGSQNETDDTPDYTNSIVTALAEVTTFTIPAGNLLTSGEHFFINSALNFNEYYVDTVVDAVENDQAPADKIRIPVNVLSTDTNLQAAAKYALAIDGVGDFNALDNGDSTITVTNSQFGTTTDASNADMPVPFAINVDTQGIGSFNFTVIDDENLTMSIKRLDEAIQIIDDAIDVDPYEEPIEIVVGAPSNDRELTGPVAASTAIKIPKNTRNGNVQESYVVDGADLAIFLNGDRLAVDQDYTEDSATEFSLAFGLVVGDRLVITKVEAIGGGAGGGSSSGVNLGTAQDADVFKQTVGDQLQFRRLVAGAGTTIIQDAEKITITSTPSVANATVQNINGANYVILSNDDVILVSNNGSDVTMTLPDATSNNGKVLNIKKVDAGNTMFIKSISGQTLDGIDIDVSPLGISVQYENVTVVSNGVNWFIL